jgi:predicted ArsR family transcriptional regulator
VERGPDILVAVDGPAQEAATEHPSGHDRDGRFAAAVTAVSAAFGDPTRRAIFLHVRAHPGATASDVARAFSLHPNVARHHLDVLVSGGYVQVGAERRPKGVGRPSKRFYAVDEDPALGMLTRQDGLLVALLAEALERLGPQAAEQMAAQVGEQYGRSLAAHMAPHHRLSRRAAMHDIAAVLTSHGFAAHAEDHGAGTAVVAGQCPFGGAAETHPALCAADQGMVKGLLAGLCGTEEPTAMPVVLSSRARGDETCAALA